MTMDRRELLGGAVLVVFGAACGIGGTLFTNWLTKPNHKLEVEATPYERDGDKLYFGYVANKGDVGESDIRARLILNADAPIVVDTYWIASDPTRMSDDIKVNTQDTQPGDDITIVVLDIPRLAPGESVTINLVPKTTGTITEMESYVDNMNTSDKKKWQPSDPYFSVPSYYFAS